MLYDAQVQVHRRHYYYFPATRQTGDYRTSRLISKSLQESRLPLLFGVRQTSRPSIKLRSPWSAERGIGFERFIEPSRRGMEVVVLELHRIIAWASFVDHGKS